MLDSLTCSIAHQCLEMYEIYIFHFFSHILVLKDQNHVKGRGYDYKKKAHAPD